MSRRVDDHAHEVRLQRFSALVAALPSAAIALLAVLAADPVAHALGKPSLAGWLQQLAPFLVFSTLLIVATGALEGRSRIAESIFWGEAAPNAVRIVLLPLVVVLESAASLCGSCPDAVGAAALAVVVAADVGSFGARLAALVAAGISVTAASLSPRRCSPISWAPPTS